tara:strand:+ start:207 stop:389 length:183 start_codon:yes stop_codon:yes gene_type:complete
MASFGMRTLLGFSKHHCFLVVDHLSPEFIRWLAWRDFLNPLLEIKKAGSASHKCFFHAIN